MVTSLHSSAVTIEVDGGVHLRRVVLLGNLDHSRHQCRYNVGLLVSNVVVLRDRNVEVVEARHSSAALGLRDFRR